MEAALRIYTSGSYKTADMDLVMIRDDLARALFDRLGFIREGSISREYKLAARLEQEYQWVIDHMFE
ncbi:hypothetical protein [Paenibacillus sp. FSL R7-0652]|uniref:hypothetical protein n=1 Tax=Paenibacillus sp. FSL R7-0652 TaxID=2921687 RepID=UPI00315A3191